MSHNIAIDTATLGRTAEPEKRSRSWWTDKMEWGALVPSLMTRSGLSVTPDTALALAGVYAAINVISTDIACLPLKLYRKRSNGGRDLITDHPLADLLTTSPDGETTSMRWRQANMGHALGWGNGYAEVVFDGDGYPSGLYLLDANTTYPERRPQDKVLFYRTKDGTLPPRRVLHVAGLGFDGLKGYSPITKAREAISLGLAAEAFGSSFFGNSARPSGLLKHPGKLKADALNNLRDSWAAMQTGTGNTGKPAILEEGMEWVQLTIPPEDAQFLATRKFQLEEIARLYRVPLHKLANLDNAHLANIEASNLDYLTTTLAPWCRQVEQEFSLKLLTRDERRQGYYIEHAMQALLRGDMAARSQFYTSMWNLGALSPNEIRDLENLNPVDGGDQHFVQLNMQTLENASKPQPAPMPTPDPAPAPDPADPVEPDADDEGDPADA